MSEGPSERMRRLHHYLVEHRWGEPSDIVVYDGAKSPNRPGALPVVHVAIWDADADCDVTTYATFGMSELVMPHADYRAELTLGCRGRLKPRDRSGLATFVANVTEYPFMYDRKLDWWERLANPGRIPAFTKCPQLLLAPMFGDEEFCFPEPDSDVKMLCLVPITAHENQILAKQGRSAFLDYWEQSGIDIFAPRSDKQRGG